MIITIIAHVDRRPNHQLYNQYWSNDLTLKSSNLFILVSKAKKKKQLHAVCCFSQFDLGYMDITEDKSNFNPQEPRGTLF